MGTACLNNDIKHAFPEGLEALDELKVSPPSGDDSNSYPQELNLLSGGDDEEYAWVHAAGYLHGEITTVWEWIRDEEIYVNLREVTEYSVTEQNSDSYDYVYLVHNIVEDIITVEFDLEWRHGSFSGDVEAPESVAIRWQKTEGTEHIGLLEGSLQLFPVENDQGTAAEDVVEVQFVYHLTSTLDQEENAVNYINDVFERWHAAVNGLSMPEYE